MLDYCWSTKLLQQSTQAGRYDAAAATWSAYTCGTRPHADSQAHESEQTLEKTLLSHVPFTMFISKYLGRFASEISTPLRLSSIMICSLMPAHRLRNNMCVMVSVRHVLGRLWALHSATLAVRPRLTFPHIFFALLHSSGRHVKDTPGCVCVAVCTWLCLRGCVCVAVFTPTHLMPPCPHLPLCSSVTLWACIAGKLLEVNPRLLTDPSLLFNR